MLQFETVKADEIRAGEAFLVGDVNWTAQTDAEFVHSDGNYQVRAINDAGDIRFIELTKDTYDVAYYAQYSAV